MTFKTWCGQAIDKINNKLHGLLSAGGLVSPSGGFASLAFDQVQLNGTPSAFCINQIVPGSVVYHLNGQQD